MSQDQINTILNRSQHWKNLQQLKQQLNYVRKLNTKSGLLEDGWHQHSQKEGITIYTKEDPQFIAVASRGVIPFDLQTVFDFVSSMEAKKIISPKQFDTGLNIEMEDLLSKGEKIEGIDRKKYLEMFDGFNYTYQRNKTIMMIVQARDFV